MKLQIVHLESHEDLASAKDRLAWAKADHLLFVWPRHGQILQRQLDLVLLQREANRRGLNLGLLTHDPLVRDNARRIGLPLFDELDEASQEDWQPPTESGKDLETAPLVAEPPLSEGEPRTRRARGVAIGRDRPTWMRVLSLGVGLVALASLLLVSVHSATVEFEPRTRTRQTTLTLVLDESLEPEEIGADRIPAYPHEVKVSVQVMESASGLERFPAGLASGEVVFTNLTAKAIEIPAGTSIRITGLESPRFQTLSPASLPAAEGSEVSVVAEAVDPGLEGNVDAGLIDAVDGNLGLSVAVENPEPFSGGDLASQPIVTEGDLDRAMTAAAKQLLEIARPELEAALPEGQVLIPATMRIRVPTDYQADRVPGEAALSVRLTMTATVEATAYRPLEARRALSEEARSSRPVGWGIRPNSVSAAEITALPLEEGLEAVAIRGTWEVYDQTELQKIPALLRGLAKEQASQRLEDRFGIRHFGIEVRPRVLNRLPLLPTQIHVVPSWPQGE